MKLFLLLRPVNLLIITITMYGLGWYLEDFTNNPEEILTLPFHLLVLSTVMIAGAGNIINDYFDVRADRVNKPERLIIGKYVKRRTAIMANWILNGFAFGIAIYLSYILETFWYLFVHMLTINFLWNYSMYFKRKLIIGNVIVATLTGLVPILVGFYFYHQLKLNEISFDANQYAAMEPITGGLTWLVGALGVFAFLLNLAREIIKDAEDVDGDKLLHAQTIAIKFGTKRAMQISMGILALTLIALSIYLVDSRTVALHLFPLAIIAGIIILLCIVLLFKAEDKKSFRRINTLIKLAMICGILIPIYIRIYLEMS